MDADPHRWQLAVGAVPVEQAERESRGGARGVEGQEEAVAGVVDLAPAAVAGEATHQVAMASDHPGRGVVAEPRLERGRVDQVGEDQREDARRADGVRGGHRARCYFIGHELSPVRTCSMIPGDPPAEGSPGTAT